MVRMRLLLSSVAIAGSLLLAGCTGQQVAPSASPSSTASSAAPGPSASATPSVSSTPPTAEEQRYVTAVQQLSSTLAPVDPAVLIAIGHDVCASFADGQTVEQVSGSFARLEGVSDLTGAEAAVIIGAAVPTLCPQYRDRLSAR